MRFISPRIHGVLDYTVGAGLIAAPLVLDFAASSVAAATISIIAGIGLVVYSLLTDYSAGLRGLIPWRVHLRLDAIAALVLFAAPFIVGFGGIARSFYLVVAIAVLAVVATSRLETDIEIDPSTGRSTVTKGTRGRGLAALAIAALAIALGPALLGAQSQAPGPSYDAQGNLRQPGDLSWRQWVHIGTPLTPNSLNPPVAPFPEFHNVYIRPSDFQHYARTGTFRDGTILIKELVSVGATRARSGNGFFEGEFIGLEATVKDARRFPDEPGNWAYFTFSHEEPPYPPVATRQPTAACNACHEAGTRDGAARDFVFVSYYPVLRAARR